ncbi:MAG: hypothetical protein ACPGVU_09135 [Limisphaerales bacterium]
MQTKLILLICCFGVGLCAADSGDGWIDVPPSGKDSPGAQKTGFESLKAEVIIGKLNIFWRADQIPANEATLLYSPDHPGHWAAREWRELPMRKRQNLFDVKVPVSDVDLPIVYYVRASSSAGAVNSPARMVNARKAGMEKSTTVFWPFAEGFEHGARNWTLSDSAKLSSDARSGDKSLKVRIPADKHSVSVSTTRVRGWHFLNQRAQAIRVWLKASSTGKVRFTLTADARTSGQTSARSSVSASVSTEWQAFDIPLESFSLRNIAGVDLFTIELIGTSGSELLIDDLQFIGRWHVKGL